ncbi:MAG: hypothetical protein NVSMB5_26400 [Candidatus Velthaea sp.]
MKLGDYLHAIGVGIAVVAEVHIDEAQLKAGAEVPVNIQVGTEGGQPVHLRGVLTTKP